ncbi:MAG: dTDP-4-dehydrorhamnose reductase family protein [Mongoliitalea sp.]
MQKKKVLIIGATGMLGHMVHRYFESLGAYHLSNAVFRTPLNKESIICDVRDQQALNSLFAKTQPHVVINCVGALVQESKENPANAIYLNALLPHILKDLCNQFKAKLIHISTDCVFSGKKGSYREDDFRDADDVYGRSKALGEIFEEPHCTLRTSIIGPELKENGVGLFAWFMRQEGEVNGYTQAFWSGVTTHELAKQILKVILHDLKGLFHITNGEKISKFDLLKLFNRLREKPIGIHPYDGYRADKSLLTSERFNFEVPGFEEMISNLQLKKIVR